MSDVIRLLPDSLANQIAAGEVVQRPASVVKELLENSIDAGSTSITVIIKEAGKTLIKVIDNGHGMTETDARMSFERHATSKIRASEDLFKINTMGFRGEALASIAAVSQLELVTKTKERELGTAVAIEGSEFKKQEPEATNEGTSISVKNLFFNVPARRNFLKSNPVEMKHIIEEFQRVALSHPEIEFSLFQNDLETFNLPKGKLSQRIVRIFGKNYKEQLAACEEDTPHIKVHGYIGKPEFAKKTRGEQYFFVNKRFIKNNYLNHAVYNAYEGLIPDGSYPFYVLFIEIDPKSIDINVHPTKTEIKFEDERTVYGIVRAAVKQALGTHNLSPSIDFDHDVNFNLGPDRSKGEGLNLQDRDYAQFKNNPADKANKENWEKLFEGLEGPKDSDVGNFSLTFESAANQIDPKELSSKEFSSGDKYKAAFQIHNTYIGKQVKSGMMFIDQQAAHERILFEKYLTHLENRNGASQQSLFPQTIDLNISDFALVMELKEEIESLGFVFEIFGKNSVVIHGVPADIAHGNEKELFDGLLEQFKENKSELSIPTKENLARSIAKRSAIKPGNALSVEEMNTMIDQLFGCENPNYSPGGQLIYYILDLYKIASFFGK